MDAALWPHSPVELRPVGAPAPAGPFGRWILDRRCFMTAILGGFASLGLGGAAMARTGARELEIAPTDETGIAAALDQTDAAFTQYHNRPPHHRAPHHRAPHRRPPPPPVVHRRRHRRRVVRNGRVYYVY